MSQIIFKLNNVLKEWKHLEDSIVSKSVKELPAKDLETKVHELQQQTLDLFNFPFSRNKWDTGIERQVKTIYSSSLNIEKFLKNQSGYSRGSDAQSQSVRVAHLKKTDFFQELTSIQKGSLALLHNIEHLEKVKSDLEKSFSTGKNPAALELNGNRYLDQAVQNPNMFEFYSNWGVRFLEKASDLYQAAGNIDQACTIRTRLSRFPLAQHVPLGRLKEDLDKKSAQIYNPLVKREMFLGIGYNDQGGSFVRRNGINARRLQIDGKTVTELNTKLLRGASDKVRQRLQILQRPEVQARLIGENICASVEVRQDPYLYYGYEGNQFTKKGALEVGTALVAEFPGLGKVEIGNDPLMDSMYNKLRITLEEGKTEQDLQNICGLCGLSFLMTHSTIDEQKRTEFHYVFHQLYPKLSTKLEFEQGFDLHESSIEVITARIQREPNGQKILADINSHLKDVENYTISPGCEGFRLKGLEREVEAIGCRGFMMGVRSYAPSRDIVKTTAAMLASGIISSQQRFDQGIVAGGTSSIKDIQNNSGDAIFTRNITQNAIDQQVLIAEIPLVSSVQILLATEVIEQQHYCHLEDSYGCRNPQSVKYGNQYRTRPNIIEHTQINQRRWNGNNEVMFKERLESGYARGITFQDTARRTLLQYLQNHHPNFFPQGMLRQEEQLQYISQNIEAIKQLVEPVTDPNILLPVLEKHYPNFFPPAVVAMADRLQYIQDHEKEAHDLAMPQLLPVDLRGYRIEDHWGIDIKEELKYELKALGINRIYFQELDLFIQQREYFTNEMFRNCHHS